MKIKACIPTVLAALSLFILPASAEPLSPPGTGTVIDSGTDEDGKEFYTIQALFLIHISEPTRRTPTSYAVFCLP